MSALAALQAQGNPTRGCMATATANSQDKTFGSARPRCIIALPPVCPLLLYYYPTAKVGPEQQRQLRLASRREGDGPMFSAIVFSQNAIFGRKMDRSPRARIDCGVSGMPSRCEAAGRHGLPRTNHADPYSATGCGRTVRRPPAPIRQGGGYSRRSLGSTSLAGR